MKRITLLLFARRVAMLLLLCVLTASSAWATNDEIRLVLGNNMVEISDSAEVNCCYFETNEAGIFHFYINTVACNVNVIMQSEGQPLLSRQEVDLYYEYVVQLPTDSRCMFDLQKPNNSGDVDITIKRVEALSLGENTVSLEGDRSSFFTLKLFENADYRFRSTGAFDKIFIRNIEKEDEQYEEDVYGNLDYTVHIDASIESPRTYLVALKPEDSGEKTVFVESDFYDGFLNVEFPESETLVEQTFTAPEDGVYRFMAYCNVEGPDFDLYDGEQTQARFYNTDGEYILDFAVWLEGRKSYTMKSRNSSSGSSTERVFYKKLNLQLDIPSDGSNESKIIYLTHINPKLATAPHNVTLTGRTLFCDGGWNTLCLPFTLDTFDGTPLEGYTVMELDTETPQDGKLTGYDSSTGTLCLNFKNATSITAGKPYIAKKSITYNENDTPTYTATSGTKGSITPAQDYDNLVDGSKKGDRWRTTFEGTNIPSYCEFQAPGPVDVTGYVLTTGNQTTPGDPKVWTLKGKKSISDDWTTIDSRNVGENPGDALPSERTADKEYAVQNPGAYRYFRFEVSEVTGVPESGNTFLCLTELTMKGNYAPASVVNPSFSNVIIVNNAPSGVASKDGKVQFKGTYDKISFVEDNKQILFLGGEDKLYYPQANASIGACHAYFRLNGIEVGDPNQVKAMVLNFDGDATGISNPSDYFDLSKYSENWYDLNGRRLTGKPSRKGIYIRNGRKEVLR